MLDQNCPTGPLCPRATLPTPPPPGYLVCQVHPSHARSCVECFIRCGYHVPDLDRARHDHHHGRDHVRRLGHGGLGSVVDSVAAP